MRVPHFRLDRRLVKAENRFRAIQAIRTAPPNEDDWARAEALMNYTWQTWCLFCRQLVMTSALGGVTRSGAAIPGCITPPDWKRVSYIASCAFSGNTPKLLKTNSSMKKEPTWGNVDKLVDIMNALNTSNAMTVLSALSIASRCATHIQIIRNCTAHMCGETFQQVKDIRSYYNNTALRHPCDAAFWIEPHSGTFAFTSWLADMRQAANQATA